MSERSDEEGLGGTEDSRDEAEAEAEALRDGIQKLLDDLTNPGVDQLYTMGSIGPLFTMGVVAQRDIVVKRLAALLGKEAEYG